MGFCASLVLAGAGSTWIWAASAKEAMLGVPVVPISAAKNQGVDELAKHALHIARYQERPLRQDHCGPEDNGGGAPRCPPGGHRDGGVFPGKHPVHLPAANMFPHL